MIRVFGKVDDPWDLTWARWHDLLYRVVPKLMRLARIPAHAVTQTEVTAEEMEMKTREIPPPVRE